MDATRYCQMVMKRFASAYPDFPILQVALAELKEPQIEEIENKLDDLDLDNE